MTNSKLSMELSKREKSARCIQRFFAKNKAKLPASIDDSMAYITGYRDSHLQINSSSDLIDLTQKCARYCYSLADKETLQLLMYAFLRRAFVSSPYGYRVQSQIENPIASAIALLDIVLKDHFKIYQRETKLQTQDLAVLFISFLDYLNDRLKNLDDSDEDFLSEFYYGAMDKWDNKNSTSKSTTRNSGVKLWYEKFNSKKKPDDLIPISRGGGLYQFVDVALKRFCLVTQFDDGKYVRGMYVTTPRAKVSRDEFYAHGLGCLGFLDIPSVQKGKIKARYLKSTNNNDYEAFVEAKDLVKMSAKSIHLLSLSQKTRLIFQEAFDKLLPYLEQKASAECLSRLQENVKNALPPGPKP